MGCSNSVTPRHLNKIETSPTKQIPVGLAQKPTKLVAADIPVVAEKTSLFLHITYPNIHGDITLV